MRLSKVMYRRDSYLPPFELQSNPVPLSSNHPTHFNSSWYSSSGPAPPHSKLKVSLQFPSQAPPISPYSSILPRPPVSAILPPWCVCGRRRTCPAAVSSAPPVGQSPGCGPPGGGLPCRSPRGHTLPSGPAARLPPAACQRWCRCSGREEEKRCGWVTV